MDANKEHISGIFQNGRLLEIPFYQRAYVWSDPQWSRFLEDTAFITKSKREFFFGSIILKEASVTSADGEYVTEKKIVTDGQQRLTTLMIFMKVLALKTNNNGAFDGLFCLDDGTPSLCHGKYDAEAFKAVISKTEATSFPEDQATSQIIKAFNYFVNNLSANEYSWNDIKKYALFVSIDLLEKEDEQQVFDTINSPGVSLSTSELLKNYFFNKNDIAEYNEKWIAIFEKDEDCRDYWNQIIDVGHKKQPLIDVFFNAYFQILIQDKRWQITAEDKVAYGRVDRLAASYKDMIRRYCAGNKHAVLDEMADYAKDFHDSFDPDFVNQYVPAQYGIEHLNVIVFGLNTTTLIPYLLYVKHNVHDTNELKSIYRILEAYIMRRIVVHASAKNYNGVFNSLILNGILTGDALREALKKDQDSTDTTTYFPSDEELLYGFQNSKLFNLHSKAVLYFIECAIHPAASSTIVKGLNGYSLEHLMPKKWQNNWPSCATKEEARERDSRLLTLGNLAIITQSLNASIRDSSWANKLQGKANNPGLKLCAGGLATMANVLEKDVWDESCIAQRAYDLYNKAKEIWCIQ